MQVKSEPVLLPRGRLQKGLLKASLLGNVEQHLEAPYLRGTRERDDSEQEHAYLIILASDFDLQRFERRTSVCCCDPGLDLVDSPLAILGRGEGAAAKLGDGRDIGERIADRGDKRRIDIENFIEMPGQDIRHG